jgi:hypothetical protein
MKKPKKKSHPARPLFAAASLPSTFTAAAPQPADQMSMAAKAFAMRFPSPNAPAPAPTPTPVHVPNTTPQRPVTPPTPSNTPTSRHDGWSPDKQLQFCDMLKARHTVEEAAESVGLSSRAAYALRARDPDFAAAWRAARDVVRQALVDKALVYAFHGRVVRIYKNGTLVGDRRRQSPAMVVAALKRIRSTSRLSDPTVVAAAQDFGICLELLELGLAYPDPAATAPPAPVMPYVHNGRGWSPETQTAFCLALSKLGNVEKACEAIGKSRSIAYDERNSPECRAFAIAWDAALLVASEALIDLAHDLADKGTIEEVARYGKIVSRHRIFDARTMAITSEKTKELELAPCAREVELVIKRDGTHVAWFVEGVVDAEEVPPDVVPDEVPDEVPDVGVVDGEEVTEAVLRAA